VLLLLLWLLLNTMQPAHTQYIGCFAVTLNANRHVTGTLRGFDQFMNIVLDQTVDMKAKTDIGMVVRALLLHKHLAAARKVYRYSITLPLQEPAQQ
jgi:small nuclear ribonucleoprotein (snRNP)-like protein